MTFKRETPEVLGEPLPFETMHLTEMIAEEIKAGRVKMKVCRQAQYSRTMIHDLGPPIGCIRCST